MVTATSPSASARPIAASTTASTLRPGRGPRRVVHGRRHSRLSVRAGSPALLRSGDTTPVCPLNSVHCTSYVVRPMRRNMKVTACGVSLNVDDVPASTAFLVDHFGFRTEMAADGFASLTRDDIGINVIFLRRGL